MDAEIGMLLLRLDGLVRDPHPGLSTWVQTYAETREAIADALRAAEARAERAPGFWCDTHRTDCRRIHNQCWCCDVEALATERERGARLAAAVEAWAEGSDDEGLGLPDALAAYRAGGGEESGS